MSNYPPWNVRSCQTVPSGIFATIRGIVTGHIAGSPQISLMSDFGQVEIYLPENIRPTYRIPENTEIEVSGLIGGPPLGGIKFVEVCRLLQISSLLPVADPGILASNQDADILELFSAPVVSTDADAKANVETHIEVLHSVATDPEPAPLIVPRPVPDLKRLQEAETTNDLVVGARQSFDKPSGSEIQEPIKAATRSSIDSEIETPIRSAPPSGLSLLRRPRVFVKPDHPNEPRSSVTQAHKLDAPANSSGSAVQSPNQSITPQRRRSNSLSSEQFFESGVSEEMELPEEITHVAPGNAENSARKGNPRDMLNPPLSEEEDAQFQAEAKIAAESLIAAFTSNGLIPKGRQPRISLIYGDGEGSVWHQSGIQPKDDKEWAMAKDYHQRHVSFTEPGLGTFYIRDIKNPDVFLFPDD